MSATEPFRCINWFFTLYDVPDFKTHICFDLFRLASFCKWYCVPSPDASKSKPSTYTLVGYIQLKSSSDLNTPPPQCLVEFSPCFIATSLREKRVSDFETNCCLYTHYFFGKEICYHPYNFHLSD